MSNQKHQTIATVLRRPLQTGFTLLEILVVIGLLSILALGASTMLANDGNWQRAQETPKRWDAIRKAILGNGVIDASGNPELSGYVADMGRLPQNIAELISVGTQPVWEYEPLYKKVDSATCDPTPTPDPECYYLAGGWRGPYLYAAGSREFRDGWDNSGVDGNPATTADDIEDANNFGWQVTVSGVAPNHTDLFIKSLGFGNEVDTTTPDDDYQLDFPSDSTLPIVGSNEWLNTLATLQFNVQLNKPVTEDINGLYLRIYYIDNASLLDQSSSSSFNILNTQRTASISISPSSDLPMGRYAAVIYCDNTYTKVFDYTSDAATNCDGDNNTAPFYFQLHPGTNILNVQWNLP